MIFFSIIIPTCNRPDLLKLCLNKLIKSAVNFNLELIEIIVSDDSCDELTRSMASIQFPHVIWIKGPKKGPAANRNNGAKIAKGEWLIFLDDDIIPDEHIIAGYNKIITKHQNLVAVEGCIEPDDYKLLKKDMAECPVNITGGCFWSANIAIKKSSFETIGGFDEQFQIAANEDQDIYLRLIESYGRAAIVFDKSVKVIHPVRFATLKKYFSIYSIRVTNYAKFAIKHPEFTKIYKGIAFKAFDLYYSFLKLILNSIRLRQFRKFLQHFFDFIFGIPILLYTIKKLNK
ncbi:MAG: glycosyltransferase [Bacteroidota bacterium]